MFLSVGVVCTVGKRGMVGVRGKERWPREPCIVQNMRRGHILSYPATGAPFSVVSLNVPTRERCNGLRVNHKARTW